MRTELSVPGDDRGDVYPVVATSLLAAITTYRQDVIPAVSQHRPLSDDAATRIRRDTASWLFVCHRAMAELTRAEAVNHGGDDTDAAAAAITALRFMAQDMIFVRMTPPDIYDLLPLLTSDDFAEMADSGSDVQAWISTHAPSDRAA
jgi:hypothetical protein